MFYFYLLSIYSSLDDDDDLALITPLPHTYFLPLHLPLKHFKIFIKSMFSDYVMMIRKMLVRAELCSVLWFTFHLFFFTTRAKICLPRSLWII